MEYYKEYPRAVGLLTMMSSLVYLLAATALLLGLNHWAALGFVLLYLSTQLLDFPRHACRNCYYRGRRCISLKGRWVAVLYGRGDEAAFRRGMRRAMWGIYIVWIYPFVTLIIAQIFWRKVTLHDLLLAAVLIGLMFMRQLMRRSLGCRFCMMRESCPNVGPDRRRTIPAGVGSNQ